MLDEQFASKGESRVMIFAYKRDYCSKMAKLLNEETHYQVDYLTG